MFGRQYIAVKGAAVLSYFQYDENGKVFYTMKFVGKLIDRKEPISPDNVEVYDDFRQFYLYANEPLMTVDGKQRTLPKAVMAYGLADDPKELEYALEKLAGVLRHSKPFTAVYRRVR